MVQKFRKKIIPTVEAIQFKRDSWEEVQLFTNNRAQRLTIERCINGACSCIIQNFDGDYVVHEFDWIVKHVNGEFYNYDPEGFFEAYELEVEDVCRSN